MYYADTRNFGQHPNYASIREHYETTKPWRGTDDRPIGGRRQRWARLVKEDDMYVVSAWGVPMVTYHPDGTMTLHLASRNTSAHGMVNRLLPWVGMWGCGTNWLLVNASTVRTYPHYTHLWGAGEPIVVAVNDKTRTVQMREHVPNDPTFTFDTLFVHPERDLVGVPTITANMPERRAAYAEYRLAEFTAWVRAYLTMNAPAPITTQFYGQLYGGYQSRWTVRYSLPPNETTRLGMLRNTSQWGALAGDVMGRFNPVQRTRLLTSILRESIQRQLGSAAVHVEGHQALAIEDARRAHAQRNRSRHMLNWNNIKEIPYTASLPFVATATNTPIDIATITPETR